MIVCFPVTEDKGLDSKVFGHFGSAPVFIVVDMITDEMAAISNGNRIHRPGACNPIAGLGGQEVDAVVVGSIGGGALKKLDNAGVLVFQGREGTVAENLALFRDFQLREYVPENSCGGHDHGHGHGQGHGGSH